RRLRTASSIMNSLPSLLALCNSTTAEARYTQQTHTTAPLIAGLALATPPQPKPPSDEDINPNAGALFPGLSQTYQMASANKDNPELRRCGGKARGAHRRNDWPEEEIPMADDYSEHDLDTPTEADLDLAYGSKFLSAPDIGTRKVRTKIIKVR